MKKKLSCAIKYIDMREVHGEKGKELELFSLKMLLIRRFR